MPRSTPRAVACFSLALASFTVAGGAEAGVSGLTGEALSPFAHLSLTRTVQAGECWEQNGPDGPGYYPCGAGEGGGPFISPAIRRPDRHGVGGVGASPHLAPVSPGLAGVHGPGEAAGAHVGAPASPGVIGGAGVHGPGAAAVAHVRAPASPGIAGAAAAAPHIAAPAAPAPVGFGAVHAGGAVGAPHIGAPAAPLAGVHGPGASGVGHR